MKREEWMLQPASTSGEPEPKKKFIPSNLAFKNTNHTTTTTVNDDGMSWQARKIERAYEQAKDEKKTIEEIAIERFGSIEEFRQMEKDVQKWKASHKEKPKVSKPSNDKLTANLGTNSLAAEAIKASLKGDFKTEALFKKRLKQESSFEEMRKSEKSFDADREFASSWRGKQLDDVDDNIQWGGGRNKKKERKNDSRVKRNEVPEDPCWFCLDDCDSSLIISKSPRCYLALPKYDIIDPSGHFLIIPIEHSSSTLHLDSETLDEIRNYKKCLIRMFARENRGTIFTETCIMSKTRKGKSNHCYIEAFSVPLEVYQDAKMYFRKAMNENLGEWSGNKVIELSREKKLVNAIPKNFGFFAVNIGIDDGFVHVVESAAETEDTGDVTERKEGLFMQSQQIDMRYGKELIASLIGLERSEWKNVSPSKEAIDFAFSEFRKYDWVSQS